MNESVELTDCSNDSHLLNNYIHKKIDEDNEEFVKEYISFPIVSRGSCGCGWLG